MNRIGIFVMYDEDGLVDDYRIHIIKEIEVVVSRLIVVVNGNLTKEAVSQIQKYTDEIFFRENEGYDGTAMKDVLEKYIQWQNLQNYDELLWCNDGFFGPFISFREMIEDMASHCCDFWGITRQEPIINFLPKQKIDGRYLPSHIQSYFFVVRRNMLHSYDFKEFWETMPEIKEFEDAVIYYELRLTQFFEQKGYIGAAYTKNIWKNGKYPEHNDLWIMNHPFSMISLCDLPIVKKKCFTRNQGDLLEFSVGEDSFRVLEYIRRNTNYDIDYIWKYLIRVMNPAELNRTCNLKYVLPISTSSCHQSLRKKVAVIAHINYDDLVEECFRYLNNIPKEVDVFINTKKDSTKQKIYQYIDFYHMKNCQVVMIGDRGREIRGLLIESRLVFQEYEYVCFVHDKKTTGNLKNVLLGQKYMEQLWENTLKSRDYIYGCLSLLEENKNLGLLVPPPPYHDINLGGGGNYWMKDYILTKSLAKRLNLTCKMSENISPITLGTTFWCRTDALRPLYEHCFEEEDFPPEPVAMDGTLNHAIERIFSFVAQSLGYATGIVMNEQFAALHIQNYHEMLHVFLSKITNGYGGLSLNDIFHIPNDLWPLVETRESLFVYGAGTNAEAMIRILEQLKINISGCIVSDSHKKNDFLCGYKVYELSELELDPETMGIVIAVRDNNAVIKSLNERGMYAYCLM